MVVDGGDVAEPRGRERKDALFFFRQRMDELKREKCERQGAEA